MVPVNAVAAFLGSLVAPATCLLATFHTDVPCESLSYGPAPEKLLASLATTIFSISNFPIELEKKRAADRAMLWEEEEIEGAMIRIGSNAASMVIEMDHRRRSGRAVREKYVLDNGQMSLLGDNPAWQKPTPQAQEEALMEDLTTFNLGLTERQRLDKEGVVLPHFEAQDEQGGGFSGGGGRIWYQPDSGDDFDEEDPNEDLY